MREIKFRGQREDNGEWVCGYYVVEGCKMPKPHFIVTVEGCWYGVIPETVGQYTGLKDKNGKEVYEGHDVDVRMSFEGGTLPHRGVIVYDEEHGAFGTKNDAGVTLLHNHCLHTLEVIGNIHENPELLKE